jgi:hypothetical protein
MTDQLRTEGDTPKTLAPSAGIYSMLLMCLCMCRWMFIEACISYLRYKALVTTAEDPVAKVA